MILIQLVLIAAFIFVMVRFLSSRNSSQTKAWKKLILIFFVLIAILAVLYPEITNHMADWAGVGRGADLLLYGIIVFFVFEQLNSYIKTGEENRRITVLVRKLAILEASEYKNKR